MPSPTSKILAQERGCVFVTVPQLPAPGKAAPGEVYR
jgi:hypothetical protein